MTASAKRKAREARNITFKLVSRSENDPLYDDPNAPPNVLEPVGLKSEEQFDWVQGYFQLHAMEDIVPEFVRTDEFKSETERRSTERQHGAIMEALKSQADEEQALRNLGVEFRLEDDLKSVQTSLAELNRDLVNAPDFLAALELDSNPDECAATEVHTLADAEAKLFLSDRSDAESDEKKGSDGTRKLHFEDFEVKASNEADLEDDFVFQAAGLSRQEFLRNRMKGVQEVQRNTAALTAARLHELHVKEQMRKRGMVVDEEDGDGEEDERKTQSVYDAAIQRIKFNLQTIEEDGQFDDAESDDEDFMIEELSDEEDEDVSSGGAGLAGVFDGDKPMLDNEFEMMLRAEYNDEDIGELDEEMHDLRGEFDTLMRFRRSKHAQKRDKFARFAKMVQRRREEKTKKLAEQSSKATHAIIKQEDAELSRQAQLRAKQRRSAGLIHQEEEVKRGADDEESEEEDDEDSVVDVCPDFDWDEERRINKELEEQFKKPPKEKWDAESILSTRTNHENHPKELKVRAVDKSGRILLQGDLPANTLKSDKLREEILRTAMMRIAEEEEEEEAEEEEEEEAEEDDLDAGGDKGKGENKASGGEMVFSFGMLAKPKAASQRQPQDESPAEDRVADGDAEPHFPEDDEEDEEDTKSAQMECLEEVARRPRVGESREERRARKKAIKMMRKESRVRRRELRSAFKQVDKQATRQRVATTKTHSNAHRL